MEKIFYLAQVFSGLNSFFTVAVVLGGIALVCFGIVYIASEPWDKYGGLSDESKPFMRRWFKRALLCVFIGALGVTFVPDKKTYLFMVGGSALEKVAENPTSGRSRKTPSICSASISPGNLRRRRNSLARNLR